MDAIGRAIVAIAARNDVDVLFPVHPNPHVRGPMHEALGAIENVSLIDPLDYPDYPDFLALLDAASIVLTDSGGVQEEAVGLGKPPLVMRSTTERSDGIDAGAARLVGTDTTNLVREVFRLLDDQSAYAAMAGARVTLGDGRAGERIASILSDARG